MFTTQFNNYACVGDTITCTKDKFTFVARIEHDSDYSPNDDDYAMNLSSVNEQTFMCGVI